MTMERDGQDDDLRRAFAELRRADSEGAPAYEAVMARRRADQRRMSLVPLLGTTLAAGVLLASLVTGLAMRRTAAPSPAPLAIEEWTAPTDFLLQTPGSDILDSVPRFGLRPSLLAQDPASLGGSERRRTKQ